MRQRQVVSEICEETRLPPTKRLGFPDFPQPAGHEILPHILNEKFTRHIAGVKEKKR